jgi:hypothetical protein
VHGCGCWDLVLGCGCQVMVHVSIR